MWTLLLKWLPVFGLIWTAGVFLLGLLLGVTHVLQHIYGWRNERLFAWDRSEKNGLQIEGFVPSAFLGSLVFSILSGLFSLALRPYRDVSEADVWIGLAFGALFGPCFVSVARGIFCLFRERKAFTIISAGFMVSIGTFFGGLVDGVSGVWFGAISSGLVALIFGKKFIDDDVTSLLPGSGWFAVGAAGLVAGLLSGSGILARITFGVSFGVGISLLAGLFAVLAVLLAHAVAKSTMHLLGPLLISLRYKTLLCEHCFRYSDPFKSLYHNGQRYCEHCSRTVAFADEPGKLVVTFNQFPAILEGRTFVLSDSEFEKLERSVDLSEVYFDAYSCSTLQIERFITHLLNYPPADEVKSVKIFYTGELETLGANSLNLFRNNFEHVRQISL